LWESGEIKSWEIKSREIKSWEIKSREIIIQPINNTKYTIFIPMSFRNYCFLFCLILSACAVVKDVKTGREAYAKKQYHRAIDMLSKEFGEEKNPEVKAETAFLIAKSFDYKNEYTSSVAWYETSLDLMDRNETILSLANAYKRLGNYNAAIKAFTALYNETEDKTRFQKEINICKEVQKWKVEDHPYDFDITSFGANSEYAEYGVSFEENGDIVFVSDRPSPLNEETYNWTGNGFSDVYIANPDGTFLESYSIPINSSAHEGPLCFNSDFTEVYFTRCEAIDLRDEHCRLYYAYFQNDEWTEPLPLSFFDERINYGNPALMDQDSVIIFSARALGKDHELFYAVRQSNGWSAAEPMPDYINSAGDDMFPTTEADTLYFASDGHPGLGGLDIFKVVLNADRSFSRPENLMLPVNSSFDDFHYVIADRTSNGYSGYLSTSRGLVGDDDIMKFDATKRIIKEVPKEIDTTEIAETEIEYYLAVSISGKDESSKVNKIKDATVKINQNGSELSSDAKDGNFIFEVQETDVFSFEVKHKDFLFKRVNYNIEDEIPDGISERVYTINKRIVLDPIILDKEITLENIYYDFEKWDIREDAKPSLNELITLMNENPDLVIQLSSHTDCRGDDDYNQNLSQKRAQSAVDYIIESGMMPNRIFAKGYGENQPAVTCLCVSCSEEEHQSNRRTTFKIISR